MLSVSAYRRVGIRNSWSPSCFSLGFAGIVFFTLPVLTLGYYMHLIQPSFDWVQGAN